MGRRTEWATYAIVPAQIDISNGHEPITSGGVWLLQVMMRARGTWVCRIAQKNNDRIYFGNPTVITNDKGMELRDMALTFGDKNDV